MSRIICLWFALLAAGCQETIYFSDDEGGPRHDTSVTGQHDDELSLPYANGTSVGITLKPTGKAHGWSIVSESPELFSVVSTVGEDGTLSATGHALGVGQALIRALDENGHERHAAVVDVRAVDTARLFAHGPLRIASNDDPKGWDAAETTSTRILASGTAVFAVAYYSGGERVYGRGIAEANVDPSVVVMDQTSSGAPTNEWLFVTPSVAGDFNVAVHQGAAPLAQLAVAAVPESDLAALTVSEELNSKKNDNDSVWVLARGQDASGRDVDGVYTSWTLDGVAQQGNQTPPQQTGDLYRYRYAPKSSTTRALVATRGALQARLDIDAHDGYVADTTYLGCSAAPGTPSSGAPLVASLGFLLLALRKRRRNSGHASPLSDAPMTNERGR